MFRGWHYFFMKRVRENWIDSGSVPQSKNSIWLDDVSPQQLFGRWGGQQPLDFQQAMLH